MRLFRILAEYIKRRFSISRFLFSRSFGESTGVRFSIVIVFPPRGTVFTSRWYLTAVGIFPSLRIILYWFSCFPLSCGETQKATTFTNKVTAFNLSSHFEPTWPEVVWRIREKANYTQYIPQYASCSLLKSMYLPPNKI